MKKTEMYRKLQLSTLKDTTLTNAERLEILKVLFDLEQMETWREENMEEEAAV